MRIGLYSYNYAPEPTGIPAYNTALARWLVAHGHDVTVHAGVPHYPWWRRHDDYPHARFRDGPIEERIDGVRVRRVDHFVPTPPVSGFKRMRLDGSWILATARAALTDRQPPEVAIMIAPPLLGGLLGLWLRWRWGLRVVYHVQDLQLDAARDLGMMPRPLLGVLEMLERLILRRVDLVTTVGRAMRRRLLAKIGAARPIELFPNWADVAAIQPWSGANAFRLAWGATTADIVVAYAGNLGRKQGLKTLLAAMAIAGPRDARLRFIIAGDGAERAELESHAAELRVPRLSFIPLMPSERLAEFLGAADIHCVPQLGAVAGLVMPSKVLNIMAAGRAIVATAAPGTDLEVAVNAAGAGLVVAPEDPAALAAAVERLAGDAAMRVRLGSSGRSWVERTLSADAVVASFARRLRRLVERGPTGRKSCRKGMHRA